jgi:hypothetical protein
MQITLDSQVELLYLVFSINFEGTPSAIINGESEIKKSVC